MKYFILLICFPFFSYPQQYKLFHEQPHHISSSNGYIYIIQMGKISVFNSQGIFLTTLSKEFSNQKFDSNIEEKLKNMNLFDNKFKDSSVFYFPVKINSDSKNRLFILDGIHAEVIYVFDSSGLYVNSIHLKKQIQIQIIGGIFIDSKDNIFLGNINARLVEKFDKNFNFISSFEVRVPHEKYSTFPYSLCADSNENVYVSDDDSDLVKVFDKNGILIHRLGEWSDFRFRYRGVDGNDIAISEDDKIFVVDYNKISIYKEFKQISTFKIIPKDSKTVIRSIFYDKSQALLYVLLNYPNKILIIDKKGKKKFEILLDSIP